MRHSRDQITQHKNERYVLRKKLGACVDCNQPTNNGKTRCDNCLDKINQRRKGKKKELKEAGLCVRCEEPAVVGKSSCADCLLYNVTWQNKKHARRRAAGLCPMCGEPAVAGVTCLKHWFTTIATVTTENCRNGSAIQRLFEQQHGRCIYTGEPLIPTNNASLDHIVPVSRGGGHNIDNLQWTTKLINKMKTNMTHDEFLAKCHEIINYRSSG